MSESNERDPREENSLHFLAFSDEEQRLEAFLAAVARLAPAAGPCIVGLDDGELRDLTVKEAAKINRAAYPKQGYAHAIFDFAYPSGLDHIRTSSWRLIGYQLLGRGRPG